MKHHLLAPNSRLPRFPCARSLALLLAFVVPVAFGATIEDAEAALQRGDYASALPIYTTFAEAGDARAMVRLGGLYQKGAGVARDLPRAIAYYTDAAARGNADAQFNLGNLYLLGEGVPQDDDWAFTYYRQAAQQGHALAMKNVNEFYRAAGVTPPPLTPAAPAATPMPPSQGVNAEPAVTNDPVIGSVPATYSADELRAIDIARNAGIQVELEGGVAYAPPPAPTPASSLTALKQRLAAGETAAVRDDLEVLADAGNVEAQFLLSRLLVTLQPRTDGEALLWLKKAADGGHAEAQYALAEAYRSGHGIPPDEAEAVTWYRAAARQGHAGARQQLDMLYREAGLQTPTTFAPPRVNANPAER